MSEHKLEIKRTFNVGIEQVYQAWTDPNIMAQWMGPGTVTCKKVDIDLKVGGKYRIHMVSEDGDHVAIGEYRLIEPNKKLEYTWTWEGGELGDTLVTVDFNGNNEKTDLTITHIDFPAAEAAEKHTEGWNGCLEKLEQFINR